MTTIEEVMRYALEAGDMDRRMCIGKAQGFDVNNAYAELRAAIEQYAAERVAELTADLVSCRGTVKTELHHYERLALVHGNTPHGAAYEAEAQRLSALLGRIDSIWEQQNG